MKYSERKISQCNNIGEITDIKFGLFSKHLFQRTQQHGGSTKPLSNDKFV